MNTRYDKFKTKEAREKWELSIEKCAQIGKNKRLKNIEDYNENPTLCKKCNSSLDYDKRNYKFCSKSCAQSFNNVGKRRHGKPSTNCLICGKKTGKNAAKYCCRDHASIGMKNEKIEKWKNKEITGNRGNQTISVSKSVRDYLIEKYNNKCQKCGWGEINLNTKKVPLQIHHIDGDCENSYEENLEVLCPNCHSLTETFGNLNKNGRRSKGYRYG